MALQVGDPAPLFSDPDILTGDTFKLKDHKGKCVLVAFHGITWCPPCQFAAPILQELWDEGFSTNPDVQFVIVSVNERPDPSQLQAQGFTLPWLTDPAVPAAYQIGSAVPHYFFLDDSLNIYKIQAGTFSSDHDQQKSAVRDSIEECLAHLPHVPDVGHWVAIATILVGVIEGGGGYVFTGGKIKKIPPGDPPFGRLSPAKKDVLLGMAVSELSGLLSDADSRKKLDAAGVEAMAAAVERLRA
jgi:peroxiredoxin